MIRSVAAIANTPSANVSSRVVGTASSLPGMADAAIKTVWLDNPPLNVIGSEIAQLLARAPGDIDDETCAAVLRGHSDRACTAAAGLRRATVSDRLARRLQLTAHNKRAGTV